jgi:hypothetical protein
MANDYIPRSQTRAQDWFRTFARGIAANPGVYNLSPADSATITKAVAEFEATLASAADPDSRTKVNVAAKDQARFSAEHICRLFATQIKLNAGISDPDKIAIGVRPVNPARTQIHCPQSSPLLSVIGATPCSHTLRYRDSTTPSRSGKPFGAMFLELRVAVADAIVRDAEQARPAGMYTRNPVGVGFSHSDDRKKATYFGRWVSRRGEVGPWSLPASMSIAA